jgi:hypothetical protein
MAVSSVHYTKFPWVAIAKIRGRKMQMYYVYDENQQVTGPYSVEDIQTRLANNSFDHNTKVCVEGTEDWKSISEVPVLSGDHKAGNVVSKTQPETFKPPPYPTQQLPPVSYVGPIALTLCLCLIGGIIVIVKTGQVNSAAARGDVEAYESLKKNRTTWIVVSLIIGLVFNILYFAPEFSRQ